jgi:FkbM family methyltransferase
MAKRFRMVHAFEPVAQFAACWKANVDSKNVKLYECALGENHAMAKLHVDPADSGGTHINVVGPDVIDDGTAACARVMPLDDFDFKQVDFIKVDCEGFEHRVLAGARSTLKRWKPLVIVEQKPHKLGPNFGIAGTPAVDFLKELGYRVVLVWGGDYIMVFA